MANLIETTGLSKRYGKKYAIRDVCMHVEKGNIYGLIGRNGAGKTTIMKCINRQIIPTGGDIMLGGVKLNRQKSIKVGALVESPSLYEDTSAMQNLLYKCTALGIKDKKMHANNLLELLELSKVKDKKVKQFSLGMKQRLGLAMAMVGYPEVLMLDEPINGMDPQGIAAIREMLVHINRKLGTTIVISSHILDELAKFASVYGIIKEGRLISEFTRETLESESFSSITIVSPHIDDVITALTEKMPVDKDMLIKPNTLLIKNGAQLHKDISRFLFDRGIYLEEFRVDHLSLEEYFMRLTGGEEIA